MTLRRLLVILLVVLALPISLGAQDDSGDPYADADPITYGETVAGALTLDAPAHFYRFSATAGEQVTILLTSPGDEVDTYLTLVTANGRQLAYDDDGGGNRNSMIESFTIPETGDYIIIANSYGNAVADQPREGAFELSLSADMIAQDSPETEAEATAEATPEATAEATPEAAISEETEADPTRIAYGDSISAELSEATGVDSYQFSASAGDLVSINASSEAFTPKLSLRNSSGSLLEAETSEAGTSISDFAVLINGDYIIEISSANDSAGSYDLSLSAISVELPEVDPSTLNAPPRDPVEAAVLDIAASEDIIEIAYGSVVNGTLTEDLPTQQFSFSASAGDSLNVRLEGDFDTFLILKREDGFVLTENDDSGTETDSAIQAYSIPADGLYLLEVTSYENARQDTPTAGSYVLSFNGESQPVVELIAPESIEIAYGESVSGELTAETPYQTYTFEAGAGDLVTIRLNGDFDTLVSLQDEFENQLTFDDDGGEDTNSLIEAYEIEADGRYTIVVTSYNNSRDEQPATGSYTLSLESGEAEVVQAPETEEPETTEEPTQDGTGQDEPDTATPTPGSDEAGVITTPQGTGEIIAISPGEAVSGTLDTDNPNQRYSFTGSAGDVVSIDVEGADDFDSFVTLFDAQGQQLVSDDDSGEGYNARIQAFVLPADGEYIIQVDSYGSARLEEPRGGSYTLTLSTDGTGAPVAQETPEPEPESTPEAQEESTLEPGWVAIISIGETTSGELSPSTPSQRYAFEARAGDTITISMSADFDTFLLLYNEAGEELARNDDAGTGTNSSIADFTLPADGTYIIEASSYGNVRLNDPESGSFELSLNAADAGDDDTAGTDDDDEDTDAAQGEYPVIDSGESVSGELGGDLQRQVYSFSAQANTRVIINLEAEFDAYLILMDADGNQLTFNDDGGETLNSRIANFIVPETGEYLIVATSYDNAELGESVSGQYTLSLQLVAGGAAQSDSGEISYGDNLSGELDISTPNREYRFSASEGDVISITLSADFDAYLFLLDENGRELSANDDATDSLDSAIENFVIPADGDYIIVADSYGNVMLDDPGQGPYTLTLTLVEAGSMGSTDGDGGSGSTAGDLNYGDSVVDALTEDAPSRSYSFNAEAGDVVSIDMESDFDSYLSLLGPDGAVVTIDDDSGAGFNARIEGFEIPESGQYTIIADSYSNANGEEPRYGEFTLSLTLESAGSGGTTTDSGEADIELGETVSGVLNDDIPEDSWTFSATPDEQLVITLSSTDFDPYLFLLDADGNVIAEDDDSAGDLNSRIGPIRVPEAGLYTIVASSYDYANSYGVSSGRYDLSLQAVNVDVVEFGERISGQIDETQSTHIYEFTTSDGSMVIFDLETASPNIFMTLGTENGAFVSETMGNGADLGPVRLDAGTYTLTVSSYDSQDLASFNLTLLSVSPVEIELDAQFSANFDEGVPLVYSFEGQANTVVNIRVESDGSVDTWLRLMDEDGFVIAEDDDGGPGLDPEIFAFALPESGTYTLAIQTVVSGDNGEINVVVESAPLPSLDEGPQRIQLKEGTQESLVTFTGSAGESVLLSVRVLGGGVSEPLVNVSQNGRSIASNSIGNVERIIIEFIIPADGEVQVSVSDLGAASAIFELDLVSLQDE